MLQDTEQSLLAANPNANDGNTFTPWNDMAGCAKATRRSGVWITDTWLMIAAAFYKVKVSIFAYYPRGTSASTLYTVEPAMDLPVDGLTDKVNS